MIRISLHMTIFLYIYFFLVLVLLSTYIKRFSVSRMRDFFLEKKLIFLIFRPNNGIESKKVPKFNSFKKVWILLYLLLVINIIALKEPMSKLPDN